MEKQFITKLVESGLSTYQISKEVNRCQNTVSYWLNKYGLKTKNGCKKNGDRKITIIDGFEYRLCPRCNKSKIISEFIIRKRGGHYSYCKSCLSNQSKERHNAIKLLCVQYKGGKCVHCGYDKYIGALEFHHTDKNKDYGLSERIRIKKSFNEMKSELDKCDLVCSNCHREIHSVGF